ncbi:hypothetical protein D3C71_1491740 [compost metagenome]
MIPGHVPENFIGLLENADQLVNVGCTVLLREAAVRNLHIRISLGDQIHLRRFVIDPHPRRLLVKIRHRDGGEAMQLPALRLKQGGRNTGDGAGIHSAAEEDARLASAAQAAGYRLLEDPVEGLFVLFIRGKTDRFDVLQRVPISVHPEFPRPDNGRVRGRKLVNVPVHGFFRVRLMLNAFDRQKIRDPLLVQLRLLAAQRNQGLLHRAKSEIIRALSIIEGS